MLDINSGELLVLLVVGVIVLGPERLPQYAAQLAKFVRQARSFARSARAQMRDELGEDFDDIDWQQLDPRRYDPRRIVREALLDDDEPGLHEPRSTSSGGRGSGPSLRKNDDTSLRKNDDAPPRSSSGASGFDPDAT